MALVCLLHDSYCIVQLHFRHFLHSLINIFVNRSGPVLNGIVGHPMGAVEGFRYSNALQEKAEAGEVWTVEALAGFLADPKGWLPGTKMSFRGLRDDAEIAALIAYLASIPE